MTHFYTDLYIKLAKEGLPCQCPLGLMTHFYVVERLEKPNGYGECQCPLGLMTHFYQSIRALLTCRYLNVSMPSRADDSFLHCKHSCLQERTYYVCQCPLGLMTHFYGTSEQPTVPEDHVCQCPLGLMTHFYDF